jgi:stage II sporulation protein D
MKKILKPRRLRLPLLALLIAGVSACASNSARLPGSLTTSTPACVRVRVAGRVTAVPLEDYVLGTALSEVTPVGEAATVVLRVYEVQAIIARTYAAAHMGRHAAEGFDLCDETHCQLYQPSRVTTSSFSRVAREAVTRTAGRILTFNRRPADTVFHADCGGSTTTPAEAWGGSLLPYLTARRDEVPDAAHRTWQFSATVDEWTSLLRADGRTDPGGGVSGLRVVAHDASGRATTVEVRGPRPRQVSGVTLRSVVSGARGARAVMSSRFDIRASSGGFLVVGTGFGHGVGLCQVGAIARARRGDSLRTILEHYYPGTRFSP